MDAFYAIAREYPLNQRYVQVFSDKITCLFGCGIFSTDLEKYLFLWYNALNGIYDCPPADRDSDWEPFSVDIDRKKLAAVDFLLNERRIFFGDVFKREISRLLQTLRLLCKTRQPSLYIKARPGKVIFQAAASGGSGSITLDFASLADFSGAFYDINMVLLVLKHLDHKISISVGRDSCGLCLRDLHTIVVLLPQKARKIYEK